MPIKIIEKGKKKNFTCICCEVALDESLFVHEIQCSQHDQYFEVEEVRLINTVFIILEDTFFDSHIDKVQQFLLLLNDCLLGIGSDSVEEILNESQLVKPLICNALRAGLTLFGQFLILDKI